MTGFFALLQPGLRPLHYRATQTGWNGVGRFPTRESPTGWTKNPQVGSIFINTELPTCKITYNMILNY